MGHGVNLNGIAVLIGAITAPRVTKTLARVLVTQVRL